MGVFDKLKAIVNSKDKKKQAEEDERRRRILLETNGTGSVHEPSKPTHGTNHPSQRTAQTTGSNRSTHNAPQTSSPTSSQNFNIPAPLKGVGVLELANDNKGEIHREDFEPLAVVGKGTFASVVLVRATGRLADAYRVATANYNQKARKGLFGRVMSGSGKAAEGEKAFWPPQFDGDDPIFAMKIVAKRKLLDLKRVNDVFIERNVLAKSGEANPFVIKLRHTFQSEHKLFFVMDYMAGGDMRALINEFKRRREPMPYQTVKLYATEMALALVTLHKNGILYRDLKPENILLDAEGHCHLADFGLSKDFGVWGPSNGGAADGGANHLAVPGASSSSHHQMRASSFVGSPMYVAPEVLLRKESYSTPVDFWSYGVMLYTMLYGAEPFRGLNVKAIFDQILTQNVAFPPAKFPTPPEIIDLIAKLLIKDPARRLNGANLFSHPFFSNMDLNAVRNKEIHPEGFILKPPPFHSLAPASAAVTPTPTANGKAPLPAIPHNTLLDANQPNPSDTGHNDMYTPEHFNGGIRNSQQRFFHDFGWGAIDDLLQQQEIREDEENEDAEEGRHFDDASSDGYDGESFQGSVRGGSSAPPSPRNPSYDTMAYPKEDNSSNNPAALGSSPAAPTQPFLASKSPPPREVDERHE